MANTEIRSIMRLQNIPQWKLAEWMGVCENTVQRMLRKELPEEKKNEVIALITKSLKGEQ